MKTKGRRIGKKIFLVLVDLRSVFNVGSLFRTADAAGVSEILLVGHTPAPRDRFGRPRPALAKVALGAELAVPSRQFITLEEATAFLKKEKVFVVAVEQSPRSRDYRTVKIRYPVAFVLGAEVEGLPQKFLKAVHVIAEIPMGGKKESLNVSVAGGIALFQMLGL